MNSTSVSVPSTEMPEAGTLERLVYLRLMLHQAQQRAQDRTHSGRHSAAIQLDGACEHAMMLALGELQEAPGKSFHANFGTLKNKLGSAWSADGWSGVDRLHGTRTEAQHRGTVPDPAEFAPWAADAERFINSLVEAAFGVDLQMVSTSQAVEAEEVRGELRTAEAELGAGRFRESVSASNKALGVARRRWAAERGDALGPNKSRPAAMNDITSDYVQEAVDRMDDLAEVVPFASDLGEYIWLNSVARHLWEGVPVIREDAERALSFVIGWVLRWEAFSHRYTMDRPGAWRRSKQPPTTSDPSTPPRIGLAVATVETGVWGDPPTPSLAIPIIDVPEADPEAWLALFGEVLRRRVTAAAQGAGASHYPWTDEEGVVTVQGVATEDDAKKLVKLVEEALAEAHAAWQEALGAGGGPQVDLRELQRAFSETLVDIEFDGAPLVEEVEASSYRAGRGILAPLRVAVTIKLRLSGDTVLRRWFWEALHQAGGIGPVNPRMRFDEDAGLIVSPGDEPPTEVHRVLAAATKAVEQNLAERRRGQEAAEALRKAIEDAARSHASH